MTLDAQGILDAVAAHAAASGWFDKVNQYEALNPPGKGINCDIWVDELRPIPEMSGLNQTAALLVVKLRIYAAVPQPIAGMDPSILAAADALMRAYNGDFSLGDLVEYIDILGRHGKVWLNGIAGWLKYDGGGAARIFDITLPLVIRGLWDQAE